MSAKSPKARTAAAAVALVAAVAALSPIIAGPAQGAATKRVRIVDIDFMPGNVTITKGTTVRWTFEDEDTPHNVVSRGTKRFTNSPTKRSGSYSYRFTKTGTYSYVCTIHFNMKGRVVVR